MVRTHGKGDNGRLSSPHSLTPPRTASPMRSGVPAEKTRGLQLGKDRYDFFVLYRVSPIFSSRAQQSRASGVVLGHQNRSWSRREGTGGDRG